MSVTEAVEGGESSAAASRCAAARAFGGDRRRVVREEAGTGGVGAGAWGRGTGRQSEGGRCGGARAVALSLPFCRLGGLLPASSSPPGPCSPPPAVCLDPEQRVSWGSSGL